MAKIKKFVFGFCVDDNHDYCRGALRRPSPDGEEVLVLCGCPHHAGQEVAPPEIVERPITEKQRISAEMEDWWSNLIIHGHLEIDCTDDNYKGISGRFRNAAKDAEVKIKTRYVDGQLRVRVV